MHTFSVGGGLLVKVFFPFLRRELLVNVRVVVGDFDQSVHDEEEQIFPIKSVSVHEKYHYASPLSYDIALVELDQRIKFGRFRLTESHL